MTADGKPSTNRLRSVRNLLPLLKIAWNAGPALAAFSLACRLSRALLPVVALYVGKLIVDGVVAGTKGDPDAAGRVFFFIGVELAIAFVSDVLGRASALADSLLGDRVSERITTDLMRHAAALDLATLENPAFHDKLDRANQQTSGRIHLLSQVLAVAQDAVMFAAILASIVFFAPGLLLLLVVMVVPAFLGETHFATLGYSLLHRWTPKHRELDYLRWLGSAQESAREIKIFGLTDFIVGRYRDLVRNFQRENRRLAFRRSFAGGALTFLATAAYYAAYAVIASRALSGQISIGTLTFLSGGFWRSRKLMEGILLGAAAISEKALHLEDLFEFFRLEPQIRSKPGALTVPRPIRLGLEFQDVRFRYPGADRDAIAGVSFRLEPGRRIALVGENGAGKTTLVKLLARLYEPTGGRILLDGVDLREYDLEDWWREIGILFQSYMKYHLVLSENVGVGSVSHMQDLPRIEAAARASQAADIAARLEKGWAQMVGQRFPGGVELSGGEWQRVALARAFMRDAQVLVLDEPTAALDARAEHDVFERFSELTAGRMALLISHRFSTVRMAESILVLEHGRVVERGSHEELLGVGGRYAELFELQASSYRS